MTRLFVLALIPLLGACVSSTQSGAPAGGSGPQSGRPVSAPPPTRPAPVISSGVFRAPRVMNMPGLEGVIGANAADLQRQFGPPRLDVVEGDARKLQFVGEPCVLDVYLYPLRQGAQPTATYVDTRRASDGLDVDRAACVAALKRR